MADEVIQGTVVTFIRGGKNVEKPVPKSTENLVIIPSNIKGTGFLKHLFAKNRPYLGGLIARKEFDDIIEKVSK